MLVIIANCKEEITDYLYGKAGIVIINGSVEKVPVSGDPEQHAATLAREVVNAVTSYLSARSRSARRSNNGGI